MLFITATIWLAIVVLLAWGVNSIWLGIVRPKSINIVLLPGTLAASLGRIVALLITGATIPDAPKPVPGRPPQPAVPQPKMPVLGPVIVALVPMILLCVLLYILIMKIGTPVLSQVPADQIAKTIPLSLAAFWDQLRALITLCQRTLDAINQSDISSWKTFFFVYLMASLTLRMAPFPGNARGHILAVLTLGTLAVIGSSLSPRIEEAVAAAWPLLCLTVGWLLLLLLCSLVAKAAIVSARAVIKWD